MFVFIIGMAFKYDLLSLFELIEARPCLWDRKSPTYKNKTCKEKAWHEIFAFLDDTYEEQTQEEKKITGTLIVTKWSNIRDAFIRSLKTTSAKRNYIYADHLQFLLSSHKHNESDNNITYVNVTDSNDHESQKRCRNLDSSNLMLARKNKKAKREILEHLKTKEGVSKETNFFISFHPYISDMSEAEKLELHMDILKSIKDIKNRRLNSPPTQTDCLIEQKCNDSYHY